MTPASFPTDLNTADSTAPVTTAEVCFDTPEIQAERNALLEHSIYSAVNDLARLRLFMQQHVFAVWDFMSLLKRLQNDTAGCGLHWLPAITPELRRFVNEIVLAEETDTDANGRCASHFDLYVEAMGELGADTRPICSFIDELRQGTPLEAAFDRAEVPASAADFVRFNLQLAEQGATHLVAAAFCYGREDIIPEMFQRLAKTLADSDLPVARLQYYIDRHIELDGDQHGPLSRRLVVAVCDGCNQKVTEASRMAAEAIRRRRLFWDGVLQTMITSG